MATEPNHNNAVSSGQEAYCIQLEKINSIAKSISNSRPIIIDPGKLQAAKDKIGRIPLFGKGSAKRVRNSFNTRSILPISGHQISIQFNGKNSYTLTSTGEETHVYDRERSHSCDDKFVGGFLMSLRLVQDLFTAHADRIGDSDSEKIHISSALWDLSNEFENIFQGRSSFEEMQSKFSALDDLYTGRLNQLNRVFEKCNESHTFVEFDHFPLGAPGLKFTMVPKGKIEVRKYLNLSVASEIDSHVQYAIRSALHSLIAFPSVDPNISPGDVTNTPYPPPELKISKILESPYKDVIALCDTIIPQLSGEHKNRVSSIQKSATQKITIERLLSPDENPRSQMEVLLSLMEEHDLTEVIESTLKKELPSMYEKCVKDQTNLNQLMRDTSDTRGLLSSTENQLKNIENAVDTFSKSSDLGSERVLAAKNLQGFRKQLAEIRHLESIPEIHAELESFRNEIEEFERNLGSKVVQAHEQKSTALWVGLGQGGSQILRECLLYCLDNLNDARAGSLLNALGIDPNDMVIPMRDRKHDDSEIRDVAIQNLTNLCDAKLQALAINVGSDIDKLVEPSRPGHFLWGNVTLESELDDVVRKTRNTLRLDITQDGAGGATGLGRAYGFARRKQIAKVLQDVGKFKQGNISPSHVIITHSFAGGSGSGMVLPILQEVRRAFDADTVVWVISVGVGGKERRIQAYYNTPFIMSDILQAHYDGIHSPSDPVKEGQWQNFEIQMKAERSAMLQHLKKLMERISGEENLDDESVISNLERELKDGTWRDKRNKMDRLAQTLSDCQHFKDEEWTKIHGGKKIDVLDFDSIMEKIPSGAQETKKFNEWCQEYEPEGGRPALTFWSAWSECASDPLGLFISGEEETSETSVDHQTEDQRRRDFVPSLSIKDLDKVLKKLQNDQNPQFVEDQDGNQIPLEFRLVSNLQPFYRLLNKVWTQTEESEQAKFVEFVQTEIRGYKAALYNFNRLRKDRARQIRALTGSSNDERVKNIIVSNAHLETGVGNSTVPVENEAYTVFNSVIFDFILNIIGSQIPPDGMYLTTDAEEFDEEDLVQQTRPPLVVGLMDHRDSQSLIERSLPNDSARIEQMDIVSDLFISEELWEGQSNPLSCLHSVDSTIFLQNSLFDSTALSMLQVNPYDVHDDFSEPEALKDLLAEITNKWDEDVDFLSNQKHSLQARKTSQRQSGFTVLHFTNAIRWISTMEIDVLAKIICMDYSQQGSRYKEERDNEVERIVTSLNESWKQYRPTSNPKFHMPELKSNQDLGKFMRESGQIRREHVETNLSRLGIWHEEILRTIPPAFLNAYLPPLLLENADSGKLSEEEKMRLKNVQQWCIWHNTTNLNQDMSRMPEAAVSKFNETLDRFDLQLLLDYQQRDGFLPGPKLRLHPRLQRYFSAVRSLPSKSGDLLIPSRSTASLLPRYLMGNQIDNIAGQYSAPTFQKAGQILNWYRYIGLLPDEKRFEWSSLLRMILLCDTSFDEFSNRTSQLAKISGLNLDSVSEEINLILEQKYDSQDLHIFVNPINLWNQTTVLIKRMAASKLLAEKLLENLPDDWIDNKSSIETWIDMLGKITVIPDGDEIPDDFKIESSASMRMVLLQFSGVLFDMNQEQRKAIENRQAGINKASQRTRRIVYEIITLLGEGLSQAEYMSPNHKTDRVHFEMTGFSDKVSGRPAGLLCLSHDSGLMVGNYGVIKHTIRTNVESSIGYIDDTKEFFTASNFGPNAAMTMVLSKAPTEEAARQFGNVMDYLAGESGNTDEYLKKTKLHPYVFLYNILWLPTNIDRWTRVKNVEYIRRFQIPLKVIESHYSDPDKTRKDLKIIHEENAYKTGGVSLPEDDIRDFENCVQLNGRYRNMINLLAIMALRHQNAVGDEHNLWEGILDQREYEAMMTSWGRRAEALSRECLNPDSSVSDDSNDAGGQLCERCWIDPCICDDGGDDSGDSQDNLQSRGKAWFKAYKNWIDDHYTRVGNGSTGNNHNTLIDDSHRQDEISKFDVS